MRTTRTLVMGGCVTLLGVLSIVSGALGQQGPTTPPDNCFCGPVNNCDGVPMSNSTYCGSGEYCACSTVWNDDHTCRLAIKAICYIPA